MLTNLSIQNYALIRQLEIEFSKGLTVVTGETGAGKSILLGALNLILGKRADTRVLLNKEKKCIVEGIFNIEAQDFHGFFEKNDIDYESHAILRRELNSQGKSRAFINDTPVKLNVLKDLGEKLIDLHSQHQTSMLTLSDFQTSVIDSFAQNNSLIKKYQIKFNEYFLLSNQLVSLTDRFNKKQSEQDYYQFLLDELSNAELKQGEQEKLEQDIEVLNHAEEIKSSLFLVNQALTDGENSLTNKLAEIRNSITLVSQYSEILKDLSNRMDSCYIELSDISNDIERIEGEVDYNPEKIQEISDRLDFIFTLQNKHRVNSIGKLIEIREQLNIKVEGIDELEEEIANIKEKVNKLEEEIKLEAVAISHKRIKNFGKFEKAIEVSLRSLGMEATRFKVEHNILDTPGKNGIDKIRFVFNANKGEELQDVAKIASGGEKSRLMLALKSLTSKNNLLPTIIFDEIDNGVSGAVADKVGAILHELSNNMQVITITHLPQIAGKGNSHFLVYKEANESKTLSKIRKLNHEDRTIEIAKMLSGQDVTSASVETARHLLKN